MSDLVQERLEEIRERRETLLASTLNRTWSRAQDALIVSDLPFVLDALADAEERIEKARAACVSLGHLAQGVLAALDGDQALAAAERQPEPQPEPETEVVDLVAALRQSVEDAKARRAQRGEGS